jgi:hypothetical protein
MTFQIETVALYSRTGDRRELRLTPGAMNVITGGSQTGKTALLGIIDYVTGGSPSLPAGPVRDAVGWYGLALRRDDSRLFVGRRVPPPGQQTSEDIYVDARATTELPAADSLSKNTNKDGLEAVLTA